MPRYNDMCELSVADMDLIETALQHRKSELSLKRLQLLTGKAEDRAALEEIDATLSETHDLLGRLHNQKVFYRPRTVRNAPYIGG